MSPKSKAVFYSSNLDLGWQAFLARLFLQPMIWFSPKHRAFRRWSRTFGKARQARAKGDKTAVERFWRGELARAEASSDLLEKARALESLGCELGSLERYREAEEALRESGRIGRQAEGVAGFWAPGAMDQLGHLSWRQGRESDAEAHFLEALRTAEKELGPDHHRVAFELLGLANFYQAQRRRGDEIAVTARMLTIQEKQAQSSDPQLSAVGRHMLATTLLRLASLYAQEERDADAELLYPRAIHLAGEAKNRTQRMFIERMQAGAFRGYAKLLRKHGRVDEALPYEKQLDKLMKKIDPHGHLPHEDLDRMWG